MALNPLSARERQLPALRSAKLAAIEYPTRAEMHADALNIPAGSRIRAAGVDYVRDASAIGMASALWDIGLNGFRAADRPQNAYVAAFHDLNSPRIIRLYSSVDGRAWRLLNSLPLEADGAAINGGNPVIAYRDGWFYMLVSFTVVGSVDFRIYKTRDFTSFQQFNCTAGPSALSSNSAFAPGGSVPANEIWGADMSFGTDGVLDVLVTVPFSAPITDAYGFAAGDRRTYRTRCTNLNTMTFAAPTLEAYPTGHPGRTFQSTTGALIAPTLPLNHLATRAAGDAGFDVAFAELFTGAFPLDDLIYVPCGKGSSGFSNGEWIAGGPAYTATVARMQAVIAANPGAVVEGVLWNQGGADTGNTNYQADLTSLINRLRADVPQLAGKPFIMGERAPSAPAGTVNVNAIMATVAAAMTNVAVVSAAGLVTERDLIHFSSESYRALGARYWDQFKAMRGSVGSGATAVKRIVLIAGQSNAVGYNPYRFPSVIDASQTRTPTGWVHTVKDEILKRIRVYNGPSITGPWTFQEMVSNDTYKIEGSAIVPRRLSDGSVRWDMFVEGHDTIEDNIRSTRMMVYPGGASPTGWGSPEFLRSTAGIRHGTPLNLGFEDPAAYRAAQHVLAFADGAAVVNNEQWNQLNSGNRIIAPNHGAVYYIDSDVTNLTILDGAADEFYLACLSDSPDVGITVQQRGFPNAWSMVGFAINNAEMVKYEKRPETGRYYPIGGRTQPFMEATKGGADQIVSGSATTRVLFGTELIDIGGFFSGSIWTPPAGRYRLVASVTFGGSQSGELNFVSIRKNGSLVSTTRSSYNETDFTLVVEAYVTTRGSSTFDVVVGLGGSGSKTIRGGSSVTWFVGAPV